MLRTRPFFCGCAEPERREVLGLCGAAAFVAFVAFVALSTFVAFAGLVGDPMVSLALSFDGLLLVVVVVAGDADPPVLEGGAGAGDAVRERERLSERGVLVCDFARGCLPSAWPGDMEAAGADAGGRSVRVDDTLRFDALLLALCEDSAVCADAADAVESAVLAEAALCALAALLTLLRDPTDDADRAEAAEAELWWLLVLSTEERPSMLSSVSVPASVPASGGNRSAPPCSRCLRTADRDGLAALDGEVATSPPSSPSALAVFDSDGSASLGARLRDVGRPRVALVTEKVEDVRLMLELMLAAEPRRCRRGLVDRPLASDSARERERERDACLEEERADVEASSSPVLAFDLDRDRDLDRDLEEERFREDRSSASSSFF